MFFMASRLCHSLQGSVNNHQNMYKYKALKINGKRIDEHRHVMQLHLGRKLDKNEVVRHRNGDTRDNRLENLYLINRQDQVKEQIASGQFSAETLKAIERKKIGIETKRKRYPKKKSNKIKSIKILPVKIVKPEKTFETKTVDTSEKVSLRINSKTIIYIPKDSTPEYIEKIKSKYSKR